MAGQTNRRRQARSKARAAVQQEIERQKRREEILTDVFEAMDARDDINDRIAEGLKSLLDSGESKQSIRDLTGLSAKEIADLVDSLEDDEQDESGDQEHGDDWEASESNNPLAS